MTVISDRRVRLVTVAIGVAGLIAAGTTLAAAQDISVNFGQGSGLTERVIQMIAMLTVLSLAPQRIWAMTLVCFIPPLKGEGRREAPGWGQR